MKRKLLLLALMVAVVACVFVLSVSAATEVCHEGVYYSLDDTNQTAALTNKNVNCEVVDLVIPETITIGEGENAKTYTVTTIWGDAFAGSGWPGNKTTKKITIPSTVSSIGTHAFRNCTALEEVVMNGTTKSFSNAEFYGCTSLWKLDMSGMTSESVTIGQYFAFNTALSDLKLPPTLTKISGTTPFKSSALTTLELPDSLVWLGDYAFQNCSSLRTVKLSASLEYLGCNNFQNAKITEIVIPATVTTLTKDIFHGSKVEKIVFASTSVTTFNATSTFASTGSLQVLFYAGATESDAKAFTGHFGDRFNGWTYIPYSQYDPTKTYTNTIVYGTTNCDECSDVLGAAQLVATDLVSVIENKSVCSCGEETVIETFDAPIVYLGYSKKEGNSGSICIGYLVNNDSLEMYKEITGKDVSYGVVAYIPAESEDITTLKPVLDDGTLADPNYTISTEVTAYSSFEFLMRGFGTDEANAIALVMCAYAKIGDKVYYLGINQDTNQVSQTEYATLVTYNTF